SQDVTDFLGSDFGKAVVNNSAMQLLLKQAPSAINILQEVFYLTEGEKQFLLSAGVGEGIFFAGANHVAIQIVPSENEYNLITTNPNDKEAQQQATPTANQLDIQSQTTQLPESAPDANSLASTAAPQGVSADWEPPPEAV